MVQAARGARIPTDAVVVLVGPSSSGKTTWATAAFRPEQIVSSDELRAVVGESRHDLSASADAFDLLDRIIDARLGRQLLTVVDTLGLDGRRRAELVTKTVAAGMTPVAVLVTTPATIIRSRNKTRSARLPAKIISSQIAAAAALTDAQLLAEGFADVVEVSGDAASHDAGTADPPAVVVPTDAQPVADVGTESPRPVDGLRFGLQIGRFDGPAAGHGPRLVELAQAAEAAGFTSLWVMDHMLQIPQVGGRWEDMLESYTTLAYLAGVTSRIRLGVLVTAITVRRIPHLAKILATLDVLSGGRANCGLGAAWFREDHTVLGIPMPPVTERYDLLRDACELLPLLWGPGTPAFEGRTLSVPQAICYPRPLQSSIPILIGGSGERTTLRLVAEYADACNLFGDPATVAARVRTLRAHCADVDRDPGEIQVTNLMSILTAVDQATLDRRVAELTPSGRAPESTIQRFGAAPPDVQIERLAAYADAGVQEAILTLPAYDTERVEELAPLLAAFNS